MRRSSSTSSETRVGARARERPLELGGALRGLLLDERVAAAPAPRRAVRRSARRATSVRRDGERAPLRRAQRRETAGGDRELARCEWRARRRSRRRSRRRLEHASAISDERAARTRSAAPTSATAATTTPIAKTMSKTRGQRHAAIVGLSRTGPAASAPAQQRQRDCEQLRAPLDRLGRRRVAVAAGARRAPASRACAARAERATANAAAATASAPQRLGLREVRGEQRETRPTRARTRGRSGTRRRRARGCTRRRGTRPAATKASEPQRRTRRDARRRSRPRRAIDDDGERDERAAGIRVRSGRPRSSSSACAPTPEREREGRERPARARVQCELRRERRADRDVGEVPERVRRVQQRHVVAPAARARARRRRAAPRRSRARGPRRRCRRRGSSRRALHVLDPGLAPELEQAGGRLALVEAADARAEEAPDLVPARRDQRARRRAARRGRRAPTSGRQTPRGRPNSSIAIVPPGRTTRASSRRVAAGSST